MIGLIRKDIYLIVKNLQISILFGIIPPLFVAISNPGLLMPLAAIVIPMTIASNVTSTMSHDEEAKWRKNLTAMPITKNVEAGSKIILHTILSLVSAIMLMAIGYIASSFGAVNPNEILPFALYGFCYALLYGFITIPASFKYGTSNSRYFFMMFIFVPTMVPVLLTMLNIEIDPAFIANLSGGILYLIAGIGMCIACAVSMVLSVRALRAKDAP